MTAVGMLKVTNPRSSRVLTRVSSMVSARPTPAPRAVIARVMALQAGERGPRSRGADTNFFVLLDQERVWVVNRDELLDIHEKVNARPRTVPCFSRHPSADRLRVFFPVKHKTDWDVDVRVFPASHFPRSP